MYLATENAAAAINGGQIIREIDQQNRMDIQAPQQPIQLDINKETGKKTEPSNSAIKILITGFIFKGNKSFNDETLTSILKDSSEKEYSFSDLQKITNKIEQFYQEQGYTFSHAFIPPQEISDGKLTIEITEGSYGKIKINNQSRLKDYVIKNTIRSIKTNKTIQSNELESTLIRLNQIPGIDAKSTLQPGTENGQADLIIDVNNSSTINGELNIDNFGDKDTGAYKTTGGLIIKNPSGTGDQLNLRAMISNLENQYQRIAYQLPTNIGDAKIGIAYSSIQYKVGRAFRDLNLSGNVNSQSIYLQQPIISQTDRYADMQLQYEDRIIKDKGDYYGSTIKKQINVVSLSISGGGANVFTDRSLFNLSTTYSTGRVAIHNTNWDSYYQKTTRSQGGFSKLVISANQTKWLSSKLSAFGQIYAQWADKNLDPSEKIGLGGPYGVRAYAASDVSGDIGFISNIELRYAIKQQIQASVFYDYGKVHLNKNGWGQQNPFIQRAATGAALEWASKYGSIKLTSALPITLGKDEKAKKAPSVWVQLSYSL